MIIIIIRIRTKGLFMPRNSINLLIILAFSLISACSERLQRISFFVICFCTTDFYRGYRQYTIPCLPHLAILSINGLVADTVTHNIALTVLLV